VWAASRARAEEGSCPAWSASSRAGRSRGTTPRRPRPPPPPCGRGAGALSAAWDRGWGRARRVLPRLSSLARARRATLSALPAGDDEQSDEWVLGEDAEERRGGQLQPGRAIGQQHVRADEAGRIEAGASVLVHAALDLGSETQPVAGDGKADRGRDAELAVE